MFSFRHYKTGKRFAIFSHTTPRLRDDKTAYSDNTLPAVGVTQPIYANDNEQHQSRGVKVPF